MRSLAELGERIVIIGPSNSGKSTLAAAIGRQHALPVVYLDRLYHYPDTAWQMRPTEAFHALHAEAIAEPRWVMEGNYTGLLSARLARATGLIVLEVSTLTSLRRYLARTLWQKHRYGGVNDDNDRVTWEMLNYITRVMPAKTRRNAQWCMSWQEPAVWLTSPRQINQAYQQWQLLR